jgi:hypothetical protein
MRQTDAMLRLTGDFPRELAVSINVCGMKMIWDVVNSGSSSICLTIFLASLAPAGCLLCVILDFGAIQTGRCDPFVNREAKCFPTFG